MSVDLGAIRLRRVCLCGSLPFSFEGSTVSIQEIEAIAHHVSILEVSAAVSLAPLIAIHGWDLDFRGFWEWAWFTDDVVRFTISHGLLLTCVGGCEEKF